MLMEFAGGPPGTPPFASYILQRIWEVSPCFQPSSDSPLFVCFFSLSICSFSFFKLRVILLTEKQNITKLSGRFSYLSPALLPHGVHSLHCFYPCTFSSYLISGFRQWQVVIKNNFPQKESSIKHLESLEM